MSLKGAFLLFPRKELKVSTQKYKPFHLGKIDLRKLDTYRVHKVDHRFCEVVGMCMRRAILLVLGRKKDVSVTAKS